MRKTKIICTIGPSSQEHEILVKMIEQGMDVARLNFSHGNFDEHAQRIKAVRKAAKTVEKAVAIMLDTKGPEIRTGLLANKKIRLEGGQHFILSSREILGNEHAAHISYEYLHEEISPGDTILLSDGLISLQVEEVKDKDIHCLVMNGGELGEKKGVNIPGVRINLPFLSDKDRQDINFGIDQGVDYIAASFVRTSRDVLEIKRILEQRNSDIDIIAKIESQEGVDNLENIIKVADGVMVARGDLGVEIPMEEVPIVQKILIEKCNQAAKIVIIATQMLDSMIQNPRPTRAEVSDVANAIFDGADAIMLSGETAAGKYPLAAVEAMNRIALRAQEALPYQDILRQKRFLGKLSVTDAICYASCATALNLGASAIISATSSGDTAKMVAKYRPQADIIAATPHENVLRKLAMVWGVQPVLSRNTTHTDDLLDESIRIALEEGYIQHGDLVVLTAGIPSGFSGGTNLLKVQTVGEVILRGMGIGEVIRGKIRLINIIEDLERIEAGDIVVTHSADSSFAPYLEKIAAIIAEEGGLTSNAAIIGLNAKIPVIVGAKDALFILEEGMLVTVDTPRGKVFKGAVKV